VQPPPPTHCVNCCVAIPDELKLDVIDPYDPFCPSNGDAKAHPKGEPSVPVHPKGEPSGLVHPKDYVRQIYSYDTLRFPKSELSTHVFCTPQCALFYSLRSLMDATMRSQIKDLFETMMKTRHGITEPCIPSPPPDALAERWEWCYPEPAAIKPSERFGLTRQEFWLLCAQNKLVTRIAGAHELVAPDWDEGQALQDHNPRFVSTMFTDTLPKVILDSMKTSVDPINTCPYPDSDTETDYSNLTIHEPK
jgi:hypothetical protein